MAGGIAAVAGAFVPALARSTAVPRSAGIEPLSLVDSEFRAPLAAMSKSAGTLSVNAKNLEQSRKPWMTGAPAATPSVEKRSIPGRSGAPDVPVYVINAAASDRKRPAILHSPGGGFGLGSAVEGIPALQQVAREHDCVVVTVNYRLAPETRFPGSLEDNYAALKWLHASASTRHVPPYIGAYIWVPTSNRFGWSSLLGVPAGSRTVPAGAVPARVDNLAGLPPAFIGVGAIDLFVEEDMDYAKRLVRAGVPTELCVVPGAYHGFDLIAPDAAGSKAFGATWNAALAKVFARNTRS